MGPACDLLAEPGGPVQDPFRGEARFPRQERRAGGSRTVGGLPQVNGPDLEVKERRKVAEGPTEVPFGPSRDGEGEPPLLAEVPEQRRGGERVTKLMMGALFALMLVLAVRAMLLPGAREGLAFYLLPDLGRMREAWITEAVFAAMGQAFFTLSLGIGSMAVFGSYIGRERSLTGETVNIILLDTFVAVASGLIIFPACFAFGVKPNAGPGLLFITLPAIFNQMAGGRVWGALFFAFMSFAALSTVVAVFENIVSYWIDVRGWSRRKAVRVNLVAIPLLALPCVLGFNVWRGFQPLGQGTNVLDLEDFVVSSTLLPLGSLVMLGFCCWRRGWGWNRFLEEANAGRGLKFPAWARVYATYVLPAIVVAVFVYGYVGVFKKLIG